ncbi:MAG: Uma2 family endonuclease [Pseudomonadota bacterium]
MALAHRDQHQHTYGEYRTWPEEARYELIDGLAYAMAPAPSIAHQDIVGEVFRQIANALENSRCRPFVAPVDVRLPKAREKDEQIDTVVQPDILVVCDASKIDAKGVRGAPDWIIEVLSPATATHDHIAKRRIYERHGVREYWLVHPTDRMVTIYRLDNNSYGKPDVVEMKDQTAVGIMPEIIIEWERVTRRLAE